MKLRHNLLCTAIAASTLAGLPLSSALAVGNVKLLFNSNPRAIALSKTGPASANGINFYPHSSEKFLQMRLAEPLLCAEFAAGSNSNVRFKLLDANGDVVTTSGANNTFGSLTAISGNTGGIRYLSNGGDHQLILNTTNELVCYTYDTFVTPAVAKSAGKAAEGLRYSLVPVSGNVVAKGGSPDGVFADGFESPFVAPLDVVTTLNAPQTVRADQNYIYTITVSNTAAAAAVSGVVVRDFYYKAGSTSVSGAAVFQNGGWTCTASAGGSCGTTSGSGAIYAPNVSLAAGAQVTFTATRPFITSPVPATGAQFSVAAAAFTPPTAGELVQSNNSVSATGTIVVTQPPVITSLPTAQSILEDSVGGPFAFTISDPDTPVGNVAVTAASSNTTLVANAAAVIGGSGASRALTVTPTANANGSAAITVTANDGTGNTATATLNLTVIPVNDAPTFVFRSGCTASNGGSWNANGNPAEFVYAAGSQNTQNCSSFISATMGPPDEASQQLSLIEIVGFTSPGLFAEAPTLDTKNLLSFRPNGTSGTSDIQIRIRDNGGTANGGVDQSAIKVLRVRVAGAAPTMSPISAQSINEDASTGAIAFTVADTDTAPGSLVVTATSSNTALVPNGNVVLGGSGSSRNVTITPVADQFGTANITLTVSDGAQQSQQTFAVNVASVNDAPTFSNLGDQSLPTGTLAGLKTVSGWASNISVGPANEASQAVDGFFVEVLSQSTPGFLSGAPQVTNAGNLRFSLAAVADGYACLRVTLFDDGPGNAPDNNASVPVVMKVQVGPGSFSCAASRAEGAPKR